MVILYIYNKENLIYMAIIYISIYCFIYILVIRR